MKIDAEQILQNAIRDGIISGIKTKFDGYNSPLNDLIKSAIESKNNKFREMLEDAISSCMNDDTFRNQIAEAVRAKLAKTLIQRFGGEMEKQVNVLKSDPTTRARITLAIEEIVKTQDA